ncbi:MAG: DUF502 domain-containing protein [Rhodospirillaceae bacterium]
MNAPLAPTPAPDGRHPVVTRLRNYFLAGLLITAPIAITLYVTWSLVDYIDAAVTGLLPDAVNPRTYFDVPGVGIVILVLFLTLVGFLAANYLGRMAVRIGEGILNRTPVIRSFYAAVKQIFETVLSKQTQSFREVVMVEYPRKDMWALGFVIGRAPPEVQSKVDQEIYSVFVPTMSFTSGYLVFAPRSDMTKVDMTIEEALKMIVSGGIVVPPAKNLVRTTPIQT